MVLRLSSIYIHGTPSSVGRGRKGKGWTSSERGWRRKPREHRKKAKSEEKSDGPSWWETIVQKEEKHLKLVELKLSFAIGRRDFIIAEFI